MNKKTTTTGILVGVMLVAVAGCGDGNRIPLSPTSPQPGRVVTSLTISGQTSSEGVDNLGMPWLGMTPGETTRLTATGTLADGTVRDVTAEAGWILPDRTGVVTFVAPGVLRAEVPGWETIVARYGPAQQPSSVRAEATLRVAPEGVFLIGVGVHDGRYAVMDALVQVTSPAGTFSATTPVLGIVSVPALGEAVLQVEKEGFAALTKTMTVGNDESVTFHLKPAGQQ